MKAQKMILASLLLAAFSANAEMEGSIGSVDFSADISGAVDYVEDGDWTGRDMFLKLDAKVAERIGIVYEGGVVQNALDDLDGDSLTTRQAYVYVNVGSLKYLGQIELRVGKQELAFGGKTTESINRTTSERDAMQENLRERESVKIMIARDSMEGRSITALLNNLVTSAEISYWDDEEDGLEKGHSIRINGQIGEFVDTSVSYMEDSEMDLDGNEVEATLNLDAISRSPLLNRATISAAVAEMNYGAETEKITRFAATKGYGKYSAYYEMEDVEVSGGSEEGQFKNHAVGVRRSFGEKFDVGFEVKDDEQLDDVVGAITFRYNMQ
ncbi:MAG: hypothetical protein CL677_10585 [Bdellovibrionaceae bacterium]|nr:hypothetical protein [Pseudobdellovibrionaceae bacterium]|tara:strand:- start:28111 stop:29088 length:978 start_codon:yes stop_codon:yes gene_type:complete